MSTKIEIDLMHFISPENREKAKEEDSPIIAALKCWDKYLSEEGASTSEEKEGLTIDDLDLNTRPYNRLDEQNIRYVSTLEEMTWDEILDIPQMGKKSAENIRNQMWENGKCLKDNDGPPLPGSERYAEEASSETETEESSEAEAEESSEAEDETPGPAISFGIDSKEDVQKEEEESVPDLSFASSDSGASKSKEQQWLNEMESLGETEQDVARAFEIFYEASDFESELKARQAAGDLLRGVHNKNDESTYPQSIECFRQALPAPPKDIEDAKKQAQGLDADVSEILNQDEVTVGDLELVYSELM